MREGEFGDEAATCGHTAWRTVYRGGDGGAGLSPFALPYEQGIVVVSLVRALAVVGGVFLLLGHGWARWLLLAWLALHVGVSAFHSLSEGAAHLAFLLVIGYLLLRPPASTYFRTAAPR